MLVMSVIHFAGTVVDIKSKICENEHEAKRIVREFDLKNG